MQLSILLFHLFIFLVDNYRPLYPRNIDTGACFLLKRILRLFLKIGIKISLDLIKTTIVFFARSVIFVAILPHGTIYFGRGVAFKTFMASKTSFFIVPVSSLDDSFW